MNKHAKQTELGDRSRQGRSVDSERVCFCFADSAVENHMFVHAAEKIYQEDCQQCAGLRRQIGGLAWRPPIALRPECCFWLPTGRVAPVETGGAKRLRRGAPKCGT
eukprot:6502160-Heterocapsa_arctica.AAC.1